MKNTLWMTSLLLAVPALSQAENTSPWLPIPGEMALTLNHTQQEGDEAFIGDTELSASDITGGGADSFDRDDTAILLSYGISDNLALDALIGYGVAEAGNADSDSGFTDSSIGLSWRVLDEYASAQSVPTLTLHGSVIIKGSYDGTRLAALGKDENGFQVSALAGKQVNDQWAVNAEIGYEYRDGDVPEATFYQIAGTFNPTAQLGLSLAYSNKTYGGDLDIGGPGFTPERFQEVNEIRDVVKFNVGYALADNHGVAFTIAQVVDGRNTVSDDMISLTYTATF